MEGKRAGGYTSAGETNHSKLSDITLVLLGKTGAGKSSLGNVILNMSAKDGFEVTDGFCSASIYNAVSNMTTVHGRLVKVVDTPGVMDTNSGSGGGEEKALEGICDGITHCPEGVDVFLVVLRLGVRLTNEEFESILKLEKLFGEKFWDHSILVFTHGDCIGNDAAEFKKNLTAAQGQIPQLKHLMSKLKTEVQLFDASRNRESGVVDKQLKKLIFAVDQLVIKANKNKYTNELFQAANAALTAEKNAELKRQQEAANSELQTLRENLSKLEASREEDKMKMQRLQAEREKEKRRIEILELKLKETERQMAVERATAKEKLAEMAKKKKNCAIL